MSLSADSPREVRIIAAVRELGGQATRGQIGRLTGLPRAAVAASVEDLIHAGWLDEAHLAPSTGGRPAQLVELVPSAGVTGVIDVGGSRTRVGVVNLAGEILAEDVNTIDVSTGPDEVMGWTVPRLTEMFASVNAPPRRHIACGLPGPVEYITGRAISPPIMTGWEGFDTTAHLQEAFRCGVTIDNDVNMLTFAEYRLCYPMSPVLLVVKLGTGIGGGIVIDGRLLRGARGAAGDIGHIQSTPQSTALCRCGHMGCVEAVAGGWALVDRLRANGLAVDNITDVAVLARDGDPDAVVAIREATRTIGLAIADAVSLLNPDTVVLVGELLAAGEQVLAMIREAVYQRSLPLATHNLTLAESTLGPLVGILGGGQIGIDALYAHASLDPVAEKVP